LTRPVTGFQAGESFFSLSLARIVSASSIGTGFAFSFDGSEPSFSSFLSQ
jgi:hypothetical protein